ncbi:MAG: hypothetical protein JWN25_1323, partial [Verrucomicrobiales bacterium]|nr:hypothetical protein [Verrucomicrobiales bacterium]
MITVFESCSQEDCEIFHELRPDNEEH